MIEKYRNGFEKCIYWFELGCTLDDEIKIILFCAIELNLPYKITFVIFFRAKDDSAVTII